jgi:exopolysaccharide biosynthesis polyprenyl glycosylphosphotransferase
MSASAAHIGEYEAVKTESMRERVRRAHVHSPDLLQKIYVLTRQSVPMIAIVSLWIGPGWRNPERFAGLMAVPFTFRHVLIVLVLIMVWAGIFQTRKATEGRNTPRLRFVASQMGCVVKATIACTLILWAGRVILQQPGLRHLSLTGFALRCGVIGIASVLGASVLYSIGYCLSKPRLYLIVGTRKKAISAYKKLQHQRACRGRVLGFLDPDDSHAKYLPSDYLGSIDKLEGILMWRPVDMVYLALPLNSHYQTVQEAIRICERIGVEYSFSSDVFETSIARANRFPSKEVRGFVYHVVHEDYDILLKRTLDLAAAVLALSLLWPLMLVIAVAIKLTNRGPVFFTQERYGRNRRLFRIYKFRSMVANAEELMKTVEDLNEAQGPIFKIRKDPRITKVGGFLRRTSLDELPQLFNVIKGDMSLVGPRPMSLRDVERFSEASLMRRFSVMPGITGLWQVSGRSNTNFDTWIRLDLHYIDRWSLGLDLRILLRTIPTVLTGKGAQ